MKDMSQRDSREIFLKIARGEMSEDDLSGFLLNLKKKGETPEEIAGAAEAFLDASKKFFDLDYEVADCVGTGGDGLGTLNVSTAAMLIASEMGIKMAKHGNVAVSSQCGSADVLSKTGVKIDMACGIAKQCLDKYGVTFLYAPIYHPGMRYAAPVRKKLKVRTIFNVLGPLINPARPQIQLSGVYSEQLVRPYAHTLQKLGVKRGVVVHGSGVDEVAIHGPTTACLIKDGDLIDMQLHPSDVGLAVHGISEILGGDIELNAKELLFLLGGTGREAYTALVAFNTGVLYWVAQGTHDLKEAVQMAYDTIKSGKALNRFRKFIELSHHD